MIWMAKDKNAKIVVYCSLGIRSEDVAEQIMKAGYTNVYNLYGGIFEWKNKDQKVVNEKGKATENVHAFNKEWGKWLKKGKKIYGEKQGKRGIRENLVAGRRKGKKDLIAPMLFTGSLNAEGFEGSSYNTERT